MSNRGSTAAICLAKIEPDTDQSAELHPILDQLRGFAHGQAHDAAVAARYAGDTPCRPALYGIGPGLAHGLTTGHIGFDPSR